MEQSCYLSRFALGSVWSYTSANCCSAHRLHAFPGAKPAITASCRDAEGQLRSSAGSQGGDPVSWHPVPLSWPRAFSSSPRRRGPREITNQTGRDTRITTLDVAIPEPSTGPCSGTDAGGEPQGSGERLGRHLGGAVQADHGGRPGVRGCPGRGRKARGGGGRAFVTTPGRTNASKRRNEVDRHIIR